MGLGRSLCETRGLLLLFPWNPPVTLSSPPPIGVVGLGLLGSALCERLLDAGRPVRCWNRTRDKAEPLLERGAVWSNNPLAECDEVVVCLYTSDVVRETFEAMAEGVHAGQLIVDATTGGVEDARRIGGWLAERGAAYLETPIAASSEQTRRGEAVAFVGGPHRDFDCAAPLLADLVAQAHYVGEWGAAASFKLVNNLILGLNRAALAEGLALAERLGLDLAQTLAVLRQSNSYSGVMDTKGDKMAARDYATQAKLTQHAKDVRIFVAEARRRELELPMSATHLALLEAGEHAGLADADNCAIFEVISRGMKP
ncbi:2-hydroxy-3-oxopropionate reductase [Planctomycetes bacterium K2D]|uniref:2-hydroxy-3-oxopropionate reductase n=1 Tax=Botrimarina mediterranea TaxID=2528022 RepID=A0A518K9J7_9BACT|nr:2-hydroxy-3-oxopropionate reductase [Botrimarina mediterranea]QDV79057.1 2-hydroxy-3-oxopropionate reductase [Planctomycetes bacterium K2D]